ncbi:ankyrin repeat domain-containing protein [Candidatus Albibeggiatoa sp. nov. BB20]|uniref:ankyrin repeat domain-containing protein n=1 Tax=Candidatus Albibeggiatoa sp. nov. BB20 TaxID=3162723 RepID=UPI00336566A1
MSLFGRLTSMGQKEEVEPVLDDIPLDQLTPELLDQPPQYTFVAAQHAVKQGQIEKIQQYLEFNPKYVYCKDWDDSTLLHKAAQYARADIIELLLNHGADANFNFNERAPLQIAVESEYVGNDRSPENIKAFRKQRLTTVRILLKHGAQIDYINQAGEQALHIAAKLGCAELVEELLKQGADLEAKIEATDKAVNNIARTPLIMAVRYAKDKTTIHLLLNSRSNPNRIDLVTGHTPLQLVVNCQDEKIQLAQLKLLSQLLLKYKADINQQSEDEMQQTALHLAVIQCQLPLIELLVAHGASLSIEDAKKMMPIALAAQHGDADLVKFLYEKGSDLQQSRALFYAANCQRSSAALEYLLDVGVDINMPDRNGYTPLFSAISAYSLKNVKLLIDREADIKMHSPRGMTVLEHAFACWGEVECLDKEENISEQQRLNSDNARDIIDLLGGFEHRRPKMYF